MLAGVLTSLVWITQTLRLMHLIDKGIEFGNFLKIVMLLIPSLLFMILPIITVISIIFVYNRLQDERQLVILRSAGLSNFNLAKPALLAALFISIFSIYISAHLMPFSYNKLKQETNNFQKGYVSNIIKARTFNQISRTSTIYIDGKNSDGSMDGIIFFDNKIPENRTIFFARQGRIVNTDENNTQFELINGIRHSNDKQGNLTKLYFDSLAVAVQSETADEQSRSKTSLELYLHEMLWPDTDLPLINQKRLIADGHARIIWPIFSFCFVFLSLSIFLRHPFNRKSHIKQFILTFTPILIISYFHFTLQKIAYLDLNYIFLCYANVFICMILGIWLNMRKSL
jgi:lipopolysaccharide export system permease protein